MEAPAARRLLKAANAETAEHAGTRILKILVMVNTRKKFPRGILDQVISAKISTEAAPRAPGPGLKPQDNNASFEGISEAEYNKRHMKALKDADPGLKRQASSVKLSNQPVQSPSGKHPNQSNKRQASSRKLQAH